MQSDSLYSSLFFEHYNRISLCGQVLGRCSVCLFEGVSCRNTFVFYLALLTSVGLSALLWSLYQVLRGYRHFLLTLMYVP